MDFNFKLFKKKKEVKTESTFHDTIIAWNNIQNKSYIIINYYALYVHG